MITRARSLFLLCLLAPAVSHSQTIPVQSGEHADFSRLVFEIPKGAKWSLTQQGRTATLSLDGAEALFQTGRVFDKIPRQRLTSLEQSDRGAPLSLNLGCDCQVVAFMDDDRFLVVDVRDGQNANIPGLNTVVGDQPYRFANITKSTALFLPTELGQISPKPDAGTQLPRRAQLAETDLRPVPVPNRAQPAADADFPVETAPENLTLSQIRLMEQIARAARQGLLTTHSDTALLQTTAKPAMKTPDPELNVLATTRTDLDQRQIQIRNTPATPADACLPPELVNFPEWSDGRPFPHQLGDLRARLVSETGVFQEKTAIQLAQLFLFYGFGSEAGSLLQEVNSNDPQVTVLREIARHLDAPQSQRANVFDSQRNCANDLALWAFLIETGQPLPPSPDVANAILRAFSKLPKHLRKHLGPRLSRQFLLTGNQEKATEVLRAIDPGRGKPEAAQTMVQAEIDLKKGNTDAAQHALQTVLEGQSEYSPQALIELIEASYERNQPLDKQLSDLTAAFVTEYRGTELGPALNTAMVRALILEDSFDDALKTLSDDPDFEAGSQTALLSDIYIAASARADDATFLPLVLADTGRLGRQLTLPALSTVAERLLELGFTDAAETLLTQNPQGRRAPDHRLLRARLALADGKPNRALVELAGLQNAEAEPLRAEALSQIGEFGAAAESYDEIEAPDLVARSRWLEGAWDLVPTDGTGRFAKAAELAERLSAEPQTVETPLARARRLLESSAEARAGVEALLSTVADPQTEPRSQP